MPARQEQCFASVEKRAELLAGVSGELGSSPSAQWVPPWTERQEDSVAGGVTES